MTHEELKLILLNFNEAVLTFPFDDKTAVFKVGNKMFALTGLDKSPPSLNLKCDPGDAHLLRSQFKAITPGYHMNKDHWNTVLLDGSIDFPLLMKLIEDSYMLVVRTLSKKEQHRLGVI